MEVITKSPLETQKAAGQILEELEKTDGNLICIYGEMGAGKTTLIQGIAKTLGVNGRVVSPTFILMRKYPVSGNSFKNLWHIDLYRLNSLEEVRQLGIKELVDERNNLVIIEWARRAEKLLPQKRLEVNLEYLSIQKRKITTRIL